MFILLVCGKVTESNSKGTITEAPEISPQYNREDVLPRFKLNQVNILKCGCPVAMLSMEKEECKTTCKRGSMDE